MPINQWKCNLREGNFHENEEKMSFVRSVGDTATGEGGGRTDGGHWNEMLKPYFLSGASRVANPFLNKKHFPHRTKIVTNYIINSNLCWIFNSSAFSMAGKWKWKWKCFPVEGELFILMMTMNSLCSVFQVYHHLPLLKYTRPTKARILPSFFQDSRIGSVEPWIPTFGWGTEEQWKAIFSTRGLWAAV